MYLVLSFGLILLLVGFVIHQTNQKTELGREVLRLKQDITNYRSQHASNANQILRLKQEIRRIWTLTPVVFSEEQKRRPLNEDLIHRRYSR
jgi:hypothetical protein